MHSPSSTHPPSVRSALSSPALPTCAATARCKSHSHACSSVPCRRSQTSASASFAFSLPLCAPVLTWSTSTARSTSDVRVISRNDSTAAAWRVSMAQKSRRSALVCGASSCSCRSQTPPIDTSLPKISILRETIGTCIDTSFPEKISMEVEPSSHRYLPSEMRSIDPRDLVPFDRYLTTGTVPSHLPTRWSPRPPKRPSIDTSGTIIETFPP